MKFNKNKYDHYLRL